MNESSFLAKARTLRKESEQRNGEAKLGTILGVGFTAIAAQATGRDVFSAINAQEHITTGDVALNSFFVAGAVGAGLLAVRSSIKAASADIQLNQMELAFGMSLDELEAQAAPATEQ